MNLVERKVETPSFPVENNPGQCTEFCGCSFLWKALQLDFLPFLGPRIEQGIRSADGVIHAMEHARSAKDIFVRIDPGEEIHASIRALCAELGIHAAAITSGIGRTRTTEIGYLDGDGIYQRVLHEAPMELVSLQGNMALHEGEPFTHLHAMFADDDHQAHGGHLFQTTVHMVAEVHLRVLGEGRHIPMSRCAMEDSEFVRLEFSKSE